MPPYRFGRHPVTEQLDEYVSTPANARELLRQLRAGEESTFFEQLRKEVRDHVLRDVFGGASASEGPSADEAREDGRRRRVLYRKGIQAALELAFGVGKDAEVPADAAIAPIDTFWGCGQPLDQAWVGWNTTGGQRRVVLVLFSDTPAMGWDDTIMIQVDGSFPPTQPPPKGMVVLYDGADATTRIAELIHEEPPASVS
jgi:hypothetical protein